MITVVLTSLQTKPIPPPAQKKMKKDEKGNKTKDALGKVVVIVILLIKILQFGDVAYLRSFFLLVR